MMAEPGAGARSAQDEVLAGLRVILADLTGDGRPLTADPGTALLRDGIGLDSLGGTMLLTRVRRDFGVDVADEDLNLDSLVSIAALAEFIAARTAGEAGRGGAGGAAPG